MKRCGINLVRKRSRPSLEKLRRHPLEKGMATCSSILAWRTPRTGAAFHGVAKSQTGLND